MLLDVLLLCSLYVVVFLFVVRGLLLAVVRCLWFVGCCSLFVVCCLLFHVCSTVLFVVCGLAYVVVLTFVVC